MISIITKFCHGRWMTVTLNKYKFATIGHCASIDKRFDVPYRGSSYKNLHIHICDHVHGAFRLNKLNGYIDSYILKLLNDRSFTNVNRTTIK